MTAETRVHHAQPTVSIVIPCRNEGHFVGGCLDSILAGDYPADRMEVLVVDGASDDGTRAVVEEFSARHPSVQLVDNPRRITPVALNLGIRQARGEVVIRMDAHAEYPRSYVSACVATLERTGADVVGGPIATTASVDTLVARAIAAATAHPFGVGNSRFRTSRQEGYVDTVPFGAYRRDVFERFGLFDERLARNQDNEFSSRLTRNGGRIYLTPELTATYYNQATLRGLLRQAFNTGMWNVVTLRINRESFKWRYFVPLLFVVTLVVLGLASLSLRIAGFAWLAVLGLYAVLAIASAAQVAVRCGVRDALLLPAVFFLYHCAYGLGTFAGCLGRRPAAPLRAGGGSVANASARRAR
jgi:succinoglycan biosynthesis protein ExoA